MNQFPKLDQRGTLPSWIQEEGTLPIYYGAAWSTTFAFLMAANIGVGLYVFHNIVIVLWGVIPLVLILIAIALYQRVWLTHTGVAWRTLRGKAWVHWTEVDSVKEVIGNRFVPPVNFAGRTLFLPIEEADLVKVRSYMASRPTKREPLSLPASAVLTSEELRTAKHLISFAVLLIILGMDSRGVPFGLTILNNVMLAIGLMMAGLSGFTFLLGLPTRWTKTLELSEDGLTARRGAESPDIKFSEVRRAEVIHVMGSPAYLNLETASSGISLPYRTPNFDQWKDAIAARLPEGVVIK